MGKLHYCLGMKVLQDKNKGKVLVEQHAYMTMLQNFKLVSTPVDASVKFIKATYNEECIDQQLYLLAIGSLIYLCIGKRQDITYAVSNLTRFSAMPTKQHWIALKCVMHDLKGSIDSGIHCCSHGSNECICYSNAD